MRTILLVVVVGVMAANVTALLGWGIDISSLMGVVFFGSLIGLILWQLARVRQVTKVAAQEYGALVFQPVSLSSTQHLERYERAYKRANWPQRLFGKYPLEPDMPHAVGHGLGAIRTPLQITAIGRVTLTQRELSFAVDEDCRTAAQGATEFRNLDETLRFTLALGALTRVEIYEHRTVSWWPASHWLQLVGDAPEGHFNVLLAVSGPGPRARTRRMLDAILSARGTQRA